MHAAEMGQFKDNPYFYFEKWLNDNHAIARIAEPSEISGLVLYLLSPAASAVPGASFSIDGGFMAG